MALKTRGIVAQAKIETTFNTDPGSWGDSDVVVTSECSVNPKTDMVDRKALNCDIVKKNGIPVRFTTDGNISLEFTEKDGRADSQGTLHADFAGAVLYEAGLGYVYAPDTDSDGNYVNGKGGFVGKDSTGADADVVSIADDSTAGTDVVYVVKPKPADVEERKSLTVRKFYDADAVCLVATGNVINKVDLAFPQADISTATFGLEGAGYSTPTDQTKPACQATGLPFVGKSATFKYKGNAVNAMDVSFSIANTITNEVGITGNGYTNKYVVEKNVTGSFKIFMSDLSAYEDLKNQTQGSLFLKLGLTDSGNSYDLGVYMGNLRLNDVSVTDDSGKLIEITISFTAETDPKDGNGNDSPAPNPILLGIHKN